MCRAGPKINLLPLLCAGLFAAVTVARAQDAPTVSPLAAAEEGPTTYKKLSLPELMNIEVTSVSKRPEQLTETASAIQVVTSEEIRRSGATRLPEALRLASNLEVNQLNSGQWAITARGFNSGIGNKLLVMIDGRAVYSPLFAGVFWDIQDVLLEDVERIEVISGPGATLWGANAVNGVINIITKSAKDTQGLFLEGGGGTELRGFGAARYGGKLSSNVFFRVYGQYADRDSAVFPNGQDAGNGWRMGQGGLRLDWEPSATDLFTLQGDLYDSRITVPATNDLVTRGGNALGRWSHPLSEDSDFKLQMYFDRVQRDDPGQFDDALDTWDVDFQHRFPVGERNHVVWGAGYRLVEDNFRPGALALAPPRRSLQTFSGFAQDEIALVKDRLHLTLGTKLEHNDYTGVELQPGGRLAWKLTERQTLWAAVSRAVRTPSRLDRDLVLPGVTAGSPGFQSEKLLAYELGYRIRPHERVSLALATFYNDYDDLRSVEQLNPPASAPVAFGNGQEGESYGAEWTADYRVTEWWRLRAGYTAMRVDIRAKPGSTDTSSGAGEAADSEHLVSLRSSLDLPGHVQFDAVSRYVGRITNPTVEVPGYAELDLRLAWQPKPWLEVSVEGQNLLHDRHAEGTAQEIQRSMYGKVTFWW